MINVRTPISRQDHPDFLWSFHKYLDPNLFRSPSHQGIFWETQRYVSHDQAFSQRQVSHSLVQSDKFLQAKRAYVSWDSIRRVNWNHTKQSSKKSNTNLSFSSLSFFLLQPIVLFPVEYKFSICIRDVWTKREQKE